MRHLMWQCIFTVYVWTMQLDPGLKVVQGGLSWRQTLDGLALAGDTHWAECWGFDIEDWLIVRWLSLAIGDYFLPPVIIAQQTIYGETTCLCRNTEQNSPSSEI
jgi:hypothetical protein